MHILPIGPYRSIPLSDGSQMPWYIIPFDREGVCEAPETRKHLMAALEAGKYSDIYLFSHGWNNNWKDVTERYESFIRGYTQMRNEHRLSLPEGYKPLLIGLFWPSITLLTETEQAPRILADTAPNEDAIVQQRERLAELSLIIEGAQRDRFYELVQREELDGAEALELAQLMAPLYGGVDDELHIPPQQDPKEIVLAWQSGFLTTPQNATKKTSGAVERTRRSTPRAAAWQDTVKKLLPRDVVRLATVYQMKDRAGKIGSLGVRKLVEDLLGKPSRVHLIGHSYGAKVLLSALATATVGVGRKAYSMLLLQPAVSHLCFASTLPNSWAAGGYREVLNRVERPIFVTYSRHDFPLRRVFHRALRRRADKGELRVAADAATPPNMYAALGGYGPRQSGEALIDIQLPVAPFDMKKNTKLYGIDGSKYISGHGDISNPSTWWISHCASWT
jgi:hypothetical protein